MPYPSNEEIARQNAQLARLRAIAVTWYSEQESGTLTPEKDAKYKALTDEARADFDSYARKLWSKYHPSDPLA